MPKFTRRRALLALATAAAITAISGSAGQAAGKLKVRKVYLKPTVLSASSGSTLLKVQVTKPGSRITQVRAQAMLAGQPGGPIVELAGKNGTYSGTVQIPENVQSKSVNAGINVYVYTSSGNETVMIGLVSVGPGSSLPPPPPPK